MGFDDAQLFLENANPPGDAFFPGQTVQGRLVFVQNKVKTFRGFYVKLKGACDIHWTSEHSREVDGRTEYYTEDHDSHEEYVNTKLYLMGCSNGEVQLNPGQHVFPFQLVLPPNCPSSYESGNGHIRYHLKFVIDRALKFDQEREFPITVLGRRDLNADPYCKKPIQMDFEESYCCWCVSSGIFELQALVPASGFCPGQTLRCEVKCGNKSNVEIYTVKFEIIERRHYRATSHPDTRKDKTVIAKIKKGPIPGGTSRSYTVELEIPEMEVHNLDTCSYINIDYEFEVTVEPSGCHSNTDASRRILIGNIPLREFEDDIPTSKQTQLADPITHYPAPAQPNPPYLGVNSPYPGANSPHPGANSPYPGTNLGYPGANSPYPGANPPYPGANSPYPGANSPYPGTNLPFTDPSPPYPGQTVSGLQPQPPPYPGPERQFPSSPGFIMQPPENKDGANVPLLPGPGAPYPPMPATASPYAKASAPPPSTPYTEMEVPAFNPDHKEKDSSEPK